MRLCANSIVGNDGAVINIQFEKTTWSYGAFFKCHPDMRTVERDGVGFICGGEVLNIWLSFAGSLYPGDGVIAVIGYPNIVSIKGNSLRITESGYVTKNQSISIEFTDPSISPRGPDELTIEHHPEGRRSRRYTKGAAEPLRVRTDVVFDDVRI